eukprot:Colp12_sorted_trinity150504_noHs@34463
MAETKESIVVLAVDYSDHSLHAFDWVVNNILKPDDTLLILHVFPHSIPPASAAVAAGAYIPPELFTEITEKAAKQARELVEKFGALAQERAIKYILKTVEGDPREVICAVAEERHAKLLAVGSRGLGAVKRLFMGSVSSYIVHHCKRPVLVIRAE